LASIGIQHAQPSPLFNLPFAANPVAVGLVVRLVLVCVIGNAQGRHFKRHTDGLQDCELRLLEDELFAEVDSVFWYRVGFCLGIIWESIK
jgi:hypothetical protein